MDLMAMVLIAKSGVALDMSLTNQIIRLSDFLMKYT